MNKLFTDNAWEDYLFWQQSDKKKLKRINLLIEDICRHPFEGLGKPEALRFQLAGSWSRRIDEEHRLVYRIEEDNVIIIACRYHY